MVGVFDASKYKEKEEDKEKEKEISKFSRDSNAEAEEPSQFKFSEEQTRDIEVINEKEESATDLQKIKGSSQVQAEPVYETKKKRRRIKKRNKYEF